MRIQKPCRAVQDIDPVAGKLSHGDVNLRFDHVLDTKGEVSDGNLLFHAIVHAIDALILIAGEMHHGFAHRLAWNCSGIDACSADNLTPFNESDSFAEF